MTVVATSVPWLAVAVLATTASMGMFARTQRRMLRAGGTTVSMRRMVGLVYAANAVNWTLPGGTALSGAYVVRQLRRWGATAAGAGFTVAASGALSAVSFAIIAIAGSSVGGPGVVVTLATVGGLLVAATAVRLLARRPRMLSAVTDRVAGVVRLVRRDPERARAAVRSFAADVTAIHPRRRDWLAGLGFAVGNWLADLVCLYACCRGLGVGSVEFPLVLVTYVVGMSASSLSLLPAGLGVIDVAMIGTFTGTGLSGGTAVAVVVAYRVISCGLVVLVGWGCWFALRRTGRNPQMPPIGPGPGGAGVARVPRA